MRILHFSDDFRILLLKFPLKLKCWGVYPNVIGKIQLHNQDHCNSTIVVFYSKAQSFACIPANTLYCYLMHICLIGLRANVPCRLKDFVILIFGEEFSMNFRSFSKEITLKQLSSSNSPFCAVIKPFPISFSHCGTSSIDKTK